MTATIEIRRAEPAEAATLTTIAFAAKRHWGYPEAWIERWADTLTIATDYVRANPTFVALTDARFLGFVALRAIDGAMQLDHLWVLPAAMGRGVGRALFEHAERFARESGAPRLTIEGDPHAEGFYQRMGAIVVGWEPAPMEGNPARRLPLLEKRLR